MSVYIIPALSTSTMGRIQKTMDISVRSPAVCALDFLLCFWDILPPAPHIFYYQGTARQLILDPLSKTEMLSF
jgi:hypothetical protein